MRRLCLVGVLSVASVTLPAQQPAQPAQQDAPVFRTSADLVTIDAVVTDSDGQPVTNLTPDDFEVTVSGKRQALESGGVHPHPGSAQALAAARARRREPSRRCARGHPR